MINISPEVVCAIIERCREFHAKEEVSFPYENDGDGDEDWAMQVLADHGDDAVYQELCYLIDDLDANHQVELVALMWLGRGDYAAEEWPDAVREAHSSWNSRTADYVISTPLVSDYLEEGLWSLGYGCEEE